MNSDVTREEVIRANPLLRILNEEGIKLRGGGNERTTNVCPLQTHKKDHQCVSVNIGNEIWRCHDCGCGGSVIDWIANRRGIDDSQVYKELAEQIKGARAPVNGNWHSSEAAKPVEDCSYDYRNESGELVFQVVRMIPKTFRQRRPLPNGGFVWNMEGVERILYRLPEILQHQTIVVVEGEKDADTLWLLDIPATTSVGGAGKWLDGYSDSLRGKDVVIIPDTDKPGKEHGQQVLKSLADKANSVKYLLLPDPHKDVSDYVGSFEDMLDGRAKLLEMIDRCPHAVKPIPILSMQEMEQRYRVLVNSPETHTFSLGSFIPSLGNACRRLVPGELVTILAGTGVGKTALLQGLARSAHPLPTLFFELELPAELMYERFVQMRLQATADEVEQEYRGNSAPIPMAYNQLEHIHVCPESGLTVDEIESLINRSSLKIGVKPGLVLVDYIGLIQGSGGRSRYEVVSRTAEQMKVIAKRTGTIIIMATQIHRPDQKQESPEVGLYDGKDSGSLENSSGLVLGVWRPEPETMVVKVLKNTKGRSGIQIECNFNGATMTITERSQFAPPPESVNGNGHYSPPYSDPEPAVEQQQML